MKGVVLKKIGVNLDKYKLVGHPKQKLLNIIFTILLSERCLSQNMLPSKRKNLFLKGVLREK
jgi:hypothetical protein